MFENKAVRNIFDPKRKEVKGDLRKLHNEELQDLYYSPI
jgi:hypothetical protein